MQSAGGKIPWWDAGISNAGNGAADASSAGRSYLAGGWGGVHRTRASGARPDPASRRPGSTKNPPGVPGRRLRMRLRRARAGAGRVCGVFVVARRPSRASRTCHGSCDRQPRRRGRSRLQSARRECRRSDRLPRGHARFGLRSEMRRAQRPRRSRSTLQWARVRVDAGQMPRDRLVRAEAAWARAEIAGTGQLG
jgi:hypothetical protein